MDDLLIAKRAKPSPRNRERFARRRKALPLGANLGLILGTVFGILAYTKFQEISKEGTPEWMLESMGQSWIYGAIPGMAFGLVICMSLAFVFSGAKSKRLARPDLYNGIPFPADDDEEDEKKKDSEAA